MSLSVVILAAGQGTRMCSSLPKVLHKLAGRALLEHVTRTARELTQKIEVVYGYGGDVVPRALAQFGVRWVEQTPQLGTGHALLQAIPSIPDEDTVLVLYGDVPLISVATLSKLITAADKDKLGLLTVSLNDPSGYGRIVRDAHNKVMRIVEEKDATAAEREIGEINTGMLAVNAKRMRGWLKELKNSNAQREYYLTDIIALAVRDGVTVNTVFAENEAEVMGVNTKAQLAGLERHYQRMQAERLMAQGVTLADPARFDLRGELTAGSDVEIDANVIIEGKVTLGERVRIGPYNLLRNVNVGDDVNVQSHCVIEDAVIGRHCRIGPYARIRPGTMLAEGAHIGNFVEIKKSTVGAHSKINHLSYVGDTTVGREANIGAGAITCNYDGVSKHQTVIGDGAFIGSGTQLVAPVKVGDGAVVGAGSTITQDVPPDVLALSRVKQSTVPGWKRPVKTEQREKGKGKS
ncbi:MAG: bifunctional UDP-N-acetylglucosamine diphosphorylase/glucosamine-1-phosphate N-acetyltransferase GlmU [Gammaproteobacteria bacterium]